MNDTEKLRCDVLLVKRALAQSRERARELIEAGYVYSDGKRVEKPSTRFEDDAPLEVRGEVCPYVSRGAFKLLRALEVFAVDVKDAVAVDVGASTGGFTDVLLRGGARHVYAVDVGTSQLDPSLENDPRVTKMEQTNARSLSAGMFDEKPELAVMDVSFISILKILPALKSVLGENGRIISLVKPQFEAGRSAVGKHGVVTDPAAHEAVLKDIVSGANTHGWNVRSLTWSPIRGGDGNIEFLADMVPLGTGDAAPDTRYIRELVREAHRQLKDVR